MCAWLVEENDKVLDVRVRLCSQTEGVQMQGAGRRERLPAGPVGRAAWPGRCEQIVCGKKSLNYARVEYRSGSYLYRILAAVLRVTGPRHCTTRTTE